MKKHISPLLDKDTLMFSSIFILLTLELLIVGFFIRLMILKYGGSPVGNELYFFCFLSVSVISFFNRQKKWLVTNGLNNKFTLKVSSFMVLFAIVLEIIIEKSFYY